MPLSAEDEAKLSKGNSNRARRLRKEQELVQACKNHNQTSVDMLLQSILTIVAEVGEIDRDRLLFAFFELYFEFNEQKYFLLKIFF